MLVHSTAWHEGYSSKTQTNHTNQILARSLTETLIKEASRFLGTAKGIIHAHNKYYKLLPLSNTSESIKVGNEISPDNALLKAEKFAKTQNS